MKRVFAVAGLVMAMGVTAFGQAEAEWPVKVGGFVEPKAGEHPRLLFRKGDLPKLKERAKTPEGKAILAQLRVLLGENGEMLPEKFNTREPTNTLKGGDASLEQTEIGTFTFSHGAGYGLLYQLTGDKKYAELGKQAVEKVFEGQVDRDERYSWKTPGTGFRLGAVEMGVALAYDLCYDGWDEDFRKRVVKEMLTNNPPCLQHKKPLDLETMLKGNGYPAGSNHFGAYIGGPILTILAIKGDPGADGARLEKLMKEADGAMKKAMTAGHGDRGWFAEGTHTGRIAAVQGVVPALQSLKVAGGLDYITPRTNGEWVTLRFALELLPAEKGGPKLPARGPYGSDLMYDRSPMLSHSGGEFCMGFGAIAPDKRGALLWVYNHFVEPVEGGKVQRVFDSRAYPHQAVYAFVNWPIGEKEVNPAQVLPRAVEDKIAGYVVFRNRWQDANDIVITGLNGTGPRGYHKVGGRPLRVFAFGVATSFGELNGKASYSQLEKDGSGVVTMGETGLAVDFSAGTGADSVLVMTGPGAKGKAGDVPAGKGRYWEGTVGGQTVKVMVLKEKGDAPEVKAEGDSVKVGSRTYTWKEGKWEVK